MNTTTAAKAESDGLPQVFIDLLNTVQENRDAAILAGVTATITAGHYTVQGGERTYYLTDELGQDEELIKKPDSESAEESISGGSRSEWVVSLCGDVDEASRRARDGSCDINARFCALKEWLDEDHHSAASYVLDQLEVQDIPQEWRRLLVCVTEFIHFEKAADRNRLIKSLLSHGEKMQNSSLPLDRPALLAAIRRIGSILPEDSLGSLFPFIAHNRPNDTRLAAFQAINTVFHCLPPTQPLDAKIVSKAYEVAAKHWDLDVFKAGEISAVAIEATVTVAIACGEKADRLWQLATQTGRRLLLRSLTNRLHELYGNWHEAPSNDSVRRMKELITKWSHREI